MKKRSGNFIRIYLPLIIIIASVFFGIGFVVSQGGGPNIPNPGHGPEQIYGVNGWLLSFSFPNAVNNAPEFISVPSSAQLGINDWSGKKVETFCGPSSANNYLIGSDVLSINFPAQSYTIVRNRFVSTPLSSSPNLAYDISTLSQSGNSFPLLLEYRVSSSLNTLEFIRTCNPFNSPYCYNDWKCLIKFVSA